MERDRTGDRPPSERFTRRAGPRAVRPQPRRRGYRCTFDALEDRALFAGDLAGALAAAPIELARAGAAARLRPSVDAPAIRRGQDAAVAGSQVLANGNISVAFADGSTKVYHKVAKGWNVVAWNHPAASGPGWIEDSWLPDGTLVEDYWNGKNHGAAGSTDQYSRLVVGPSTITLTLYHANGVRIYWGVNNANTNDGTVTWTYARAANGGLGMLQTYHVSDPGTSYAADYINPQSGLSLSGYYASGWLEYLPNRYGTPVPGISFSGIAALNGVDAGQLANQAGVAQRNPETVNVPPGVKVQDGGGAPWKVTYRTSAYPGGADPSMVAFAYKKSDQKDLLFRVIGGPQGKDWVTTATAVDTGAFTGFITKTATYDRAGGTLLRSQTVRVAPDGATVTFHGRKDGGLWLSSADFYLGFQRVTIESRAGIPVKRYGTTRVSISGVGSEGGTSGVYAVNFYNKEGSGVVPGTRIVKREVFAEQGGRLLQTWTVSGKSIKIARDDPAPDVSHDEFEISPFDRKTQEGDEVLKYDARFKKPLNLAWDYDANPTETRDSTSYHWWAAYDVPSDSWSYRARGSSGGEHLGSPHTKLPSIETTPNGNVLPGWTVIDRVSDLYWNVV